FRARLRGPGARGRARRAEAVSARGARLGAFQEAGIRPGDRLPEKVERESRPVDDVPSPRNGLPGRGPLGRGEGRVREGEDRRARPDARRSDDAASAVQHPSRREGWGKEEGRDRGGREEIAFRWLSARAVAARPAPREFNTRVRSEEPLADSSKLIATS